MDESQRIVITGVGLTAPNGNNLAEYRGALLTGKSGISPYEIRYFGKTLAGICNFEETKYQKKKDRRRGTRAGSIAIYCANEALNDAGIAPQAVAANDRTGVYVGITEHGNVETENEVYNISQFNYDCSTWSHFHNPRTVANNPAGEITLNLKITGPHYCLGAACAAGNAGIIQGVQQLRLGEVDLALCGGVSESIHTFGIFAAFAAENALARNDDPAKASRPFDKNRNGIVISEGGCIYTLERLPDAKRRGAKIYGEIAGYGMNSDGTDFVLPNPDRQAECLWKALNKAGVQPEDIDIVNTHATATPSGDVQEIAALRKVFGVSRDGLPPAKHPYINNTKCLIGHAMGAAGVLELAGNLPAFADNIVHPTYNCDDLDPGCEIANLVINEPKRIDRVDYILNNSFGMVGINSVVIVKRYNDT
ncbi:MAG: beta-ketoacyl-[acyl-carrier-protein] synthase family protein [Planctomycetaceae bacterium]|jgi:3-oxoacyl-[acyl-carrier-protein] synthase II|nr:beta-ketoacyl-[acyl-carrier-protein] synthase family protein [Planctomycetaceae bacterium]